jgi:uncharacterized protein (DUF952 family)
MADAPEPTTVYKVLTAAELATLEQEGSFAGSADDRRDGFVHLSTADQLEGTLARHFAGQADLQLVALDVAALGEALRWEPARDGARFPHLYAPVTLETVVAYSALERLEDGHLRLPVTG